MQKEITNAFIEFYHNFMVLLRCKRQFNNKSTFTSSFDELKRMHIEFTLIRLVLSHFHVKMMR